LYPTEYLLKRRLSRETISPALTPCPVASPKKKLYFSLSSEKPKVSPDIFSAPSIFP